MVILSHKCVWAAAVTFLLFTTCGLGAETHPLLRDAPESLQALEKQVPPTFAFKAASLHTTNPDPTRAAADEFYPRAQLEVRRGTAGTLYAIMPTDQDGQITGGTLFVVNPDYAFQIFHNQRRDEWFPGSFAPAGEPGYDRLWGIAAAAAFTVHEPTSIFNHGDVRLSALFDPDRFNLSNVEEVNDEGSRLIRVVASSRDEANEGISAVLYLDPEHAYRLARGEYIVAGDYHAHVAYEFKDDSRPYLPTRTYTNTVRLVDGQERPDPISGVKILTSFEEVDTPAEHFTLEHYGFHRPDQDLPAAGRSSADGPAARPGFDPLRASVVLIVIAAVIAVTVIAYAVWRGRVERRRG